MKCRLFSSALLLAMFFPLFFPHSALGVGTFQLHKFSTSLRAVIHQPYETTLEFSYKGDYVPEFKLSAKELPSGLKFHKIKMGIDGQGYIKIDGTPTSPGDYAITLTLKDGHGATLSQPFSFKIERYPIVIITETLPSGTLNKAYAGHIDIEYAGYRQTGAFPKISFANLPAKITFKIGATTWSEAGFGTATIELFGTPTTSGESLVTLTATQGGINYNDFTSLSDIERLTVKKEFSLIIGEKEASKSGASTSTAPHATSSVAASSTISASASASALTTSSSAKKSAKKTATSTNAASTAPNKKTAVKAGSDTKARAIAAAPPGNKKKPAPPIKTAAISSNQRMTQLPQRTKAITRELVLSDIMNDLVGYFVRLWYP